MTDILRTRNIGQWKRTRVKGSNKPKYTLEECAERLGTTMVHLRAAMARNKEHPKPAYKVGRPSKSYYELETVRLWWTQLNEGKQSCTSG